MGLKDKLLSVLSQATDGAKDFADTPGLGVAAAAYVGRIAIEDFES